VRFGFVDVPGHERFVRNMLAGVGGIDLVLLVVAADEGIKPQTREHFAICQLLSIQRGLIVLTKSDLVDPETLDVVHLEVEEFVRGSFLENSPIIAVSSLKGTGLDELKRELVQAAAHVSARNSSAIARLPIDRVFTMKGFGTVVTGTLLSGVIHEGQSLLLEPGARSVRVRGLQTHGRSEPSARSGSRVAVNLSGIDASEVAAAGDAFNDVAMLTWAGTALAPANARTEVIELADRILPTNDEDGVASYLEELVAGR